MRNGHGGAMTWKILTSDGERYLLHVGSRTLLRFDEVKEAHAIVAGLEVSATNPPPQVTLTFDEEPPRAPKEELDFLMIYRLYPRKMGKASGIKWLRDHVRSRAKFDQVLAACNNYRGYCDSERIEEQYIMHFSTWVKKWEDWSRESMAGEFKKVDVGSLEFDR
jgi:hypothetical protein